MHPLSALIPECARPAPESARLRGLIAAVTDWDAVVLQAESHGMAPLLHWHVQRTGGTIPPAAAQRLRERFCRNAHRNLRFGSELLRLAGMFENAGIGVMAFKGPAISWSLYETPALREMCDLDLLVRPSDFSRAVDLLIDAGYQLPPPSERWFHRKECELHMLSSFSGVEVDLHRQLAPSHFSHALDMGRVWTRPSAVQVSGHAVPTLASEDLFVFLCVHGAKHAWFCLSWMADLARLIDRSEIDWDAVLARVRARRMSRIVFSALLLAADVFRAKVPEGLVKQLRTHPVAPAIAARLQHRLLAGLPMVANTAEELRFQFGLLERPTDKLRFCWSLRGPSQSDQQSLSLPAPLLPLHYVFRPMRIMAKYGGHALSRAPARTGSVERSWTE